MLQGFVQTDAVGKILFPNIHNVFVVNYKEYVRSIPWQHNNITGDTFRQFNGCTMLICGFLLVLNKYVKVSSFVMHVMALWSVYAHMLASDSTYMAVCGGVISTLMLFMCFAQKKEKED
uniref:Uncharacterized protein n=2 Tax=Ciona intestinalis TaxID=7719 RepID=H2XZF0_CIOIN